MPSNGPFDRAITLQRFVKHRRGQLTIVDGEGLIKVSCECYLRVSKSIRNHPLHQVRALPRERCAWDTLTGGCGSNC